MAAITISRQLGSLGCEIAHAVKDQLGYRIVWRELINQAALKACAPEMALAVIDELGFLGLSPSSKNTRAYIEAVKHVVLELADEGKVVIVGRAGQAILHRRPDILHVRIIAPVELRAQRIAQRQSISIEGASAQVVASDRSRRSFLKRFYKLDWDQPSLYDLIINTERIGPASAAGLICKALECLPEAAPSSLQPEDTPIEPL
jgi:cytidylate kinase